MVMTDKGGSEEFIIVASLRQNIRTTYRNATWVYFSYDIQ